MYLFERRARVYEQCDQQKADRLIVISPMLDLRGREVAGRLGVESYGDSVDLEAL